MRQWLKALKVFQLMPVVLSHISESMKSSSPHVLKDVTGLDGRTNDIIYHPSDGSPIGHVVFFGGDVQDYTENMLAHRDNKAHVKWNLESTSALLHDKFPSWNIFIVRAARMHLKTFSCYENFVEGNDFGAPNHSVSIEALQHLKLLLSSAIAALSLSSSAACGNCDSASFPISIIGFSKGCVVLNQLIYSFLALSQQPTPSNDLADFVKSIKVMYWLDGGHSGSQNTWVTDKSVLKNYSQLPIKTRIHVSPYQVCCDMKPRVGREEKVFRESLRRLGADIDRTLHFEDKPKSLEFHFKVLENFPVCD